ncbi:MAG: TIR domain-containing protein [Cyanobacteria bacterium P01_F01_bin.86]
MASHTLHLAYRLPEKNRLRRIALSKPRRNDIFIAYAPQDSEFVRAIDEAIRHQGFDPWIDYDDILVGPDYSTQFKQGIRGADVFVLLLSPHALQHPDVRSGLDLALELNKLIVVLSITPLQFPIKELQCVDNLVWLSFEAATHEAAFERAAQNIIHVQTYVRLLARAMEWDRRRQHHTFLLTAEDLQAVRERERWIQRHQLHKQIEFTPLQKEFLKASDRYLKQSKHTKYPQTPQPDIFISYSRKERDFVKQLTTELEKHNWKVWIDWQHIPVAADWREKVAEGIRDAHTFIAVVSQDFFLSEPCQWELGQAQAQNKRIIPFVCRDNYNRDALKASGLASIQYASCTKRPFDMAMGELLSVLNTDLDDLKVYTRLANKAHEWSTEGRAERDLMSVGYLRQIQRWRKHRQLQAPQDNCFVPELQAEQEDYIRASQRSLAFKWQRNGLYTAFVLLVLAGLSVGLLLTRMSEIRALVESLEERKGLDAVITALRAGKRVKQADFLMQYLEPNLHSKATTALHDATLKLRERNRLEGHEGAVYSLAFSPDGQQLVSVGQDRTIRFWNINQNDNHQTGFSHQEEVVTVAYSADGDYIATGSSDGSVKLWKPDGSFAKTLPRPHDGQVIRVAFSPGGQYLISASNDGKLHLWNRQDGFRQPTVLNHGAAISNVAFSPYGSLIASTDFKGGIYLWNRSGALVQQLQHAGEIYAVQFSPDGNLLAVAGTRKGETTRTIGDIEIWQRSRKLSQRFDEFSPLIFSGHDGPVYELAFSSDSALLASASGDGTAKLWHPRKIKEKEPGLVHTLRGHRRPIFRVAFSPDDEMLATGGADNAIHLWLSDKGTLVETFEGHKDQILSLAFSPKDPVLASASENGGIRLWDLNGSIQPLPHTNQVFDVAFRPDGKVLASSGYHTIRLWRRNGTQQFHISFGEESAVLALDYSPNGEFLAAMDQVGTIKIWRPNVRTDEPILTIESTQEAEDKPYQETQDLSFSPDGRWLAATRGNGTVTLWQVTAEGQLNDGFSVEKHPTPVTGVSFSADGRFLATSTQRSPVRHDNLKEGAIFLWELPGKDSQLNQPRLRFQTNPLEADSLGNVLTVDMSAGEMPLIASGGEDEKVRLWTLEGELIEVLEGHTDAVTRVDFSADGKFLVSSSRDGTVRLWTADGKSISTLTEHVQEVSSVTFGPQGDTPFSSAEILASASFDSNVLLWKLWELPSQSDVKVTQSGVILSNLMAMGCESTQPYLENSWNYYKAEEDINPNEQERLSDIQEVLQYCTKQYPQEQGESSRGLATWLIDPLASAAGWLGFRKSR